MSKAAYTKVALSYTQQLQQLKDRGLIIADEEYFLHLLEVKSYYRLSGYWYPLLKDKKKHLFKEGATFETAYKIYCFDRDLRHLVLTELEKIEVAIRAKMIYILSHKHGPFWYQDLELFRNPESHNRLLSKLETEFKRSDEDFILAFKDKYSDPLPPSWMLFEVTSFGSLSVMYSNIKPGLEKREIAWAFGLADPVFSSWIHSMVYLRNVCAHHSRLWNRAMSIQPLIPRKTDGQWLSNKAIPNNNTYFILSMLVYLMGQIKQDNDVVPRFKELLAKYPNIDPFAMGFPDGWNKEQIWNK
jgi:abortive infection bacteriophage resistance protein